MARLPHKGRWFRNIFSDSHYDVPFIENYFGWSDTEIVAEADIWYKVSNLLQILCLKLLAQQSCSGFILSSKLFLSTKNRDVGINAWKVPKAWGQRKLDLIVALVKYVPIGEVSTLVPFLLEITFGVWWEKLTIKNATGLNAEHNLL